MTHGLIPHPAGAAVQGPTSTLCAELLRMIRRESAAGFARPRQDVRHPPRMETCGLLYAALTRVLAGIRALKQARKVRDQGAASMPL